MGFEQPRPDELTVYHTRSHQGNSCLDRKKLTKYYWNWAQHSLVLCAPFSFRQYAPSRTYTRIWPVKQEWHQYSYWPSVGTGLHGSFKAQVVSSRTWDYSPRKAMWCRKGNCRLRMWTPDPMSFCLTGFSMFSQNIFQLRGGKQYCILGKHVSQGRLNGQATCVVT